LAALSLCSVGGLNVRRPAPAPNLVDDDRRSLVFEREAGTWKTIIYIRNEKEAIVGEETNVVSRDGLTMTRTHVAPKAHERGLTDFDLGHGLVFEYDPRRRTYRAYWPQDGRRPVYGTLSGKYESHFEIFHLDYTPPRKRVLEEPLSWEPSQRFGEYVASYHQRSGKGRVLNLQAPEGGVSIGERRVLIHCHRK
jgi:hypothetical protein